MLSKQYADANGILYGPCPTMIHTSVGSAGGVVGQVVGPVYSVLNPGTDVECSTSSKDGITFLVAQGVDPLYEVLLSTHVARDWGARADPVIDALEYRPYLLKKGDTTTFASVPLISMGRSNALAASATAFVVCMTSMGGREADATARLSPTDAPISASHAAKSCMNKKYAKPSFHATASCARPPDKLDGALPEQSVR